MSTPAIVAKKRDPYHPREEDESDPSRRRDAVPHTPPFPLSQTETSPAKDAANSWRSKRLDWRAIWGRKKNVAGEDDLLTPLGTQKMENAM